MSSPTDRIYEPGDPSPYAPRWVRSAPQQRRAPAPPPLAPEGGDADETTAVQREDVIGSEQAPPLARAAPADHEESFLVNDVRLRRYRVLGMLGRLALAGSAAAIVAVLAVGKLSAPSPTGATEPAGTQPSFGARFSAPHNKPPHPPHA